MISWKDCKFEDIHQADFTHCFEAPSVAAIRAALGARRPLLVRGEPGVGKSQLARAAAWALQRPLVSHVVTGKTEARDLHYRFDAVARLAQAQLIAVEAKQQHGDLDLLSEQRYVQPGPLWWVFNWDSAEKQHQATRVKGVRPEDPNPAWSWSKDKGSVVMLLDEIDKADPDVPNALLESLGNRQFSVPYFKEPIRCNPSAEAPLLIITTNEERELPPAFVRRCLVLHLALPEKEKLKEFLMERGRAHFSGRFTDKVLAEAAEQLIEERGHESGDPLVRPGQAEYLDLLAALVEVAAPKEADQLAQLELIKGFALAKNAPET
jgi:MoxR-like ATPase